MTSPLGRPTGQSRRASLSPLALACAALAFAATGLAAPQPERPAAGDPAVLAATKLAARGRQETLLTVSQFGRYSVTAHSASGTALQLVDRMAGPGPVAGQAGSRDGRLDLFLDRGTYKIVARSARKGSGQVELRVHPFPEINTPPGPTLVEWKAVEGRLRDFEQASFWLQIEERRPVAIEAAGRSLADLRLWRDGSWLVDAAPASEVVDPSGGQPLNDCRLAAELEPGLYRLTAYGGPEQDWSKPSEDHPFHLRFGIPTLAEAGRRRFAVSPFGVDRYLVAGPANYFRLELPEARAASFEVGTFVPERPFAADGTRGEIRKESLPPVAEVESEPEDGKLRIVTVRASAGQPYLLQHFESREVYSIGGDGRYWISTVHSGDPADSVDATTIAVHSPSAGSAGARMEPFLTSVASLDLKTGWRRRCNLLDRLTVFLEIGEPGTYEILSRGTEARFRVEPFLLSRPPHYEPPPFKAAGSKWELEGGFAVLTIEPIKKGIGDFVLRPVGLLGFSFEDGGRSPSAGGVHPAATFSDVVLNANDRYSFYVNEQPGVRTGLILRALPLDLTRPLTIAESAGETLSVSFEQAEPGTLRAEAEDGALLEISVDKGPWQRAAPVATGRHSAAVRNSSSGARVFSLEFVPTRLEAATPLPRINEALASSRPSFPVLTEAEGRTWDLEAGASSTFLLSARVPALYRVETSGLLSTKGNLRTRTIPSYRTEAANGVGRNFLIQDYLREGDYQVTVSTEAPSEGHVGLSLSRTELSDGGILRNGIAARASLAAGHALAYRFSVPRTRKYRLRALGLGHTFHCRLETLDGWPVDRPDIPADFTRVLEKGKYRLIVLPEALDSRVVTVLSRIVAPARLRGHGPHRLPLAVSVEKEWIESDSRTPDRFDFSLPAETPVSIDLSDEMTAKLSRLDAAGSSVPVGEVPPYRGWKGDLPAGDYRLEATSARVNNHVRYTLAVRPELLLAGLERDVAAPAEIPLSVGKEGLVELESFGTEDVRARLLDASGNILAANDDRPDDWNFQISRRLAPGRYRLEVEPVGTASARCVVSMDAPAEVEEKPLALPFRGSIPTGRVVHLYPLDRRPGEELVAAAARSVETIGLSLEEKQGESWRSIADTSGHVVRLEVPVRDSAPLRLRLWSIDRRGDSAEISAAAFSPRRVTEKELEHGVAAVPVAGFSPSIAAIKVELEQPGSFRPDAPRPRWTATSEIACRPGESVLEASGKTLWLVSDAPGDQTRTTIRARRIRLSPGTALSLQAGHEPVAVDLAEQAGAILAIAISRTGQPGIDIAASGTSIGVSRPDRAMALAPFSAATVSLSGSRRIARIWSAGPEASPIDTVVEPKVYPPAPSEPAVVSDGNWSGTISGGRARAFALPPGSKRVRLTLAPNTFAALSAGDEVRAVAWAASAPVQEEIESEADRLTLIATSADESSATIAVFPLSAGQRLDRVTAASPFERTVETSGTIRLDVGPTEPGDSPTTLRVRGRGAEGLFVSKTGQVLRGIDLPMDASEGTLRVTQPPGSLMCWVEKAGLEPRPVWAVGDVAAIDVTAPAALALEGNVRAFRFSPKAAAVLHLRSATPAVTRISIAGRAPEIEAHPGGVRLDVYLPAGSSEIAFRGLAGQPLWGIVEAQTSPVEQAGEGLGPEILLPPGGTRVFSFAVAERGPVGVGVRADSEIIECDLLSASGRTIGSGIVQMPTLDPGIYLLEVRAPRDTRPVRVRPALAGLHKPDTGPPREIIEQYLRPAGESQEEAGPAPRPGEPGESDIEEEPSEPDSTAASETDSAVAADNPESEGAESEPPPPNRRNQ